MGHYKACGIAPARISPATSAIAVCSRDSSTRRKLERVPTTVERRRDELNLLIEISEQHLVSCDAFFAGVYAGDSNPARRLKGGGALLRLATRLRGGL
jgi:hypothetical protein